MPTNWMKRAIAEAIGTFALIFIGVLSISGSRIVGAPDGLVNLASIGLAHGLTIAVMVAALGAISGGHVRLRGDGPHEVDHRRAVLGGAAPGRITGGLPSRGIVWI